MWPWTNEGTKKETTSTALHEISDRRLRVWMKKARRNGGVYSPTGWGRYFTIANLSAELARRRTYEQ